MYLAWTFLVFQIEISWIDHYRSTPYGTNLMKQETRLLLCKAGFEVTWTPSSSLRVVLLPSDPEAWGLDQSTMGVVLRDRTLPTRAVYIFVPNVLRVLGIPAPRARIPSAGEIHEIARALGRVAAHELLHVLRPDLPHSRDGLMATQLTRALLAAPEIALSRDFVRHDSGC